MSAHHVIAAGHDLTALAAEEVLRAGGNAFDAAIAALAAACVAEPVLSSLGGGGYVLALPAQGRPRVYDFFAHTPGRRRNLDEIDFYPIEADFGTATQEFHIGRGTVATPGMVAGLFRLHKDLASLPIQELFSSAVQWAREGVEITDFQAYLFDVVKATYLAGDTTREIFASSSNPEQLVSAGDLLSQKNLADSLEILAIEGPDLFYRGEMAVLLTDAQRSGGQLQSQDLLDYQVLVTEPLCVELPGVRLLTNPPPSSGGILTAFALEIIANDTLRHLDPKGSDYLLRLALSLEYTHQQRLDAAAQGHPQGDLILNADLLEHYRKKILGRAAAHRGTTQISIIDAAGNLASVTTSNGEGSGHLIQGTGIVLNNMLGEEDINPGGFQCWTEAQRMTSMMMPSALCWPAGTLVATGSGGSNRIRSALLQVISQLVFFNATPQQAVEAPRIHWEQGLLSIEGGFDLDRLAPLLAEFPRHQIWHQANMFFGGTHTVRNGPRGADGCGDARRGGVFVRIPA